MFQIIEEMGPIDDDSTNVFQCLFEDEATHAPEGRVLYLSRHGESEYNLYGKIGGNSSLSVQGEKYSASLADFFNMKNIPNLKVWTSELIRTHQTTNDVIGEKFQLPQLNEINAGEFDGLAYEEIAEINPVEFAKRDQDKLKYRYPNGESYIDVCRRLAEILPEMNKSENLLVVSHQAVIRCIVAYLTEISLDELPYIKIPLHTVIKVTLKNGRNKLEFIKMAIDCVDTYRAKPTNCCTDRDFVAAIASVPFHL